MRTFPPPFRFGLKSLLQRARQKVNAQVGGVSINLPFVTFNVRPDDLQQAVAREIVIRLADRRVLNAFECCDDCIEKAIESLQDVRSKLVEKQVAMAKMTDSPVYLLVEFMLEGIRQFLTFEQRLRRPPPTVGLVLPTSADTGRMPAQRDRYFAALEMLRAHLHRCLLQMAKIADIRIPKIADNMRYDEAWQVEAYEKPEWLEDVQQAGCTEPRECVALSTRASPARER